MGLIGTHLLLSQIRIINSKLIKIFTKKTSVMNIEMW